MSLPVSRALRPLLLSGAIALLSACGGGDSAPSGPAGSATGVLSDSPVGGVRYTTSSGLTGTTDSQGRFRYNPGDSVTFQIGSLSLGTVTVTGSDATITPLQVAEARTDLTDAERQNLVTNLLVLLQSLDSDGDAENGISIPAAVALALTPTAAATLDLEAAPVDFVASSTLGSLASTAGGEVVDPAEALVHFRTQFFKDVAGVYVADLGDNEIIAIRINADGSYLMGEVAQADTAGQPGIERGWIDWNPTTAEIGAYGIDLDTNGEWGLSHPLPGERVYMSLEGTSLKVRADAEDPAVADETLTLARFEPGTGLVGPWALAAEGAPANSLGVQQFLFLADGRYLMIDPVGDDDYSEPNDPKCGGEGLEFARYTLSGGVLTASGVIADTNDCAGLHDSTSGQYTAFGGVGFSSGSVTSSGEVGGGGTGESETLLVRPDTTTPYYVGLFSVVSTTTGNPVQAQDINGATADLFCTPPDEQGVVVNQAVTLDFDSAAGRFTMNYRDAEGPVTVEGSYDADTGDMSWEEVIPARVVMETPTVTYSSDGNIVFAATYDAAAGTVSGGYVDTVSTTWSLNSARVTCSSTWGFILERVTAPAR